jgi:HEAT repeat protein
MRMLAIFAALIAHANVANVPAAADLGRQVRSANTTWVGYSVPLVDGYRIDCNRCSLGDDNMSFSRNDDDDLHPVAGNISVFYRLDHGTIEKVRVFPADCQLEGSGTSVTWIDNVAPRNSVALLASLAGGERSVAHGAVAALAMHGDPSAGDRLEEWVRDGSAADDLRGQAVFWLAQTRPDRGLDAARQLARDPNASRKAREKAIFALSQIHRPAATDELIHIARTADDAHTRGQAIFWLSQQAGKKAAAAIRDAVDRDDDSGVRAKAVFAVSQLPDDQGIPILIDLMKNHRDPNVRRKAAFWLGQKRDPRALDALEQILRK